MMRAFAASTISENGPIKENENAELSSSRVLLGLNVIKLSNSDAELFLTIISNIYRRLSVPPYYNKTPYSNLDYVVRNYLIYYITDMRDMFIYSECASW